MGQYIAYDLPEDGATLTQEFLHERVEHEEDFGELTAVSWGYAEIALFLGGYPVADLNSDGTVYVYDTVNEISNPNTVLWLRRIFEDNRIDESVWRTSTGYNVAGKVYDAKS